jgi:hypothetical protein
MTEPMEAPESPAAPSPTRWRLLAAVFAVIAVVAIAVAGYAFARDDRSSSVVMPMAGGRMTPSMSMPMAMGDADAMYARCLVMMTPSGEATSQDTATWCRDMADRMAGHMGTGSMGGWMMTPSTTTGR